MIMLFLGAGLAPKGEIGSHSPGGGYSLIWPIRGCAAGQGMVFGLSVLNRVCDFMRVCPKQGI